MRITLRRNSFDVMTTEHLEHLLWDYESAGDPAYKEINAVLIRRTHNPMPRCSSVTDE